MPIVFFSLHDIREEVKIPSVEGCEREFMCLVMALPKSEGDCCLLLLFLTFSALVANPKKTTLHGGQSR